MTDEKFYEAKKLKEQLSELHSMLMDLKGANSGKIELSHQYERSNLDLSEVTIAAFINGVEKAIEEKKEEFERI
ncbi:hypothetical protein ACTQX5_02570 [Faecalicoccus sp. LCP19S3_E3]|uniref:hypothetical protein n=1 Tax=unclassified Faecalicoccus TaxID=2643311 RepID=UPI003F92183A